MAEGGKKKKGGKRKKRAEKKGRKVAVRDYHIIKMGLSTGNQFDVKMGILTK